jgi:hypothetical protein
VRVMPLRFILTALSVLSVFQAGCAAKSAEQASSSARPCTNYVLVVDNTTDFGARIYRGSAVVAEVSPGGTQTIAIRSPQEARSYRAVLTKPGSAAGVILRSTCQE